MTIRQTLKRWGNGQAVRLPKKLVEAARLGEDAELTIRLEGRSIILTPVNDPNSLPAMLSGVTPEAVGGEINWGNDVGAERIS